MTWTVEEQQHRVAAPFHQTSAVRVGRVEEFAEDEIEGVAHLLGPDAPPPGEPLGQRGEAGDVGEDSGAVDGAEGALGVCLQPVHHQPRQVGHEQCVHDAGPPR